MAKKVGKPESQLKPKKDNKKVDPGKQSKEEPPVKNKTEDQIENKVALKEAKTRVKMLQSAWGGIRAQIEAERRQGITDPAALQVEVDRAQLAWQKIQSELNQAKELSQKRKDEIDGWKAWYGRLPKAEKPTGLERLQREIKWRADELASNGEKIGKLIPKEFEVRGVFEMAKQKQAAFQAGVHKRAIEEDPRLKSLRAELDKTVAAVEQLEPEQPKQK